MSFKVSIIVPIYNVEKYLERCVDSLFKQSLDNLQYIFVDDCSQDNSRKILHSILAKEEYAHLCVEIITHDVNKGLAAARNAGVIRALGEYVYHCDSDDWLERDGIENMYTFAKMQDADIVWTDFYSDFGKSNQLCIQSYLENSSAMVSAMMEEKVHAGIWNKLYKRSFLFKSGIRSPEGNDMWEDMYYNLLLFSNANKIAYLSKPFYHYNQVNTSSISKSKLEHRFKQINHNVGAIITNLDAYFPGKYEKSYSALKLSAKQMFLFTTDIENFRMWVNVYPEVNIEIKKMNQLPKHLRMLGYYSYRGYWPLVYGWIILKRIARWFR